MAASKIAIAIDNNLLKQIDIILKSNYYPNRSAESELPYIISFMIRKDGRLLDGTSITEAVRIRERFVGIQANASSLNGEAYCNHTEQFIINALRAAGALTGIKRVLKEGNELSGRLLQLSRRQNAAL
jgi:methionine synthase I (cobalamin-dependent)